MKNKFKYIAEEQLEKTKKKSKKRRPRPVVEQIKKLEKKYAFDIGAALEAITRSTVDGSKVNVEDLLYKK